MTYSFFSIKFATYFLFFLLAAFVSFYLPGRFFICRLKFREKPNHRPDNKSDNFALLSLVLSLVLGISLWALQGVVLGYLQVRWLSYGYLLFFAGHFLWENFSAKGHSLKKTAALPCIFQKKFNQFWQQILADFRQIPSWLRLLFLVGASLQLLVIFGSGFLANSGIKFYFVNASEPVMHLAYIQALIRNFPPFEPGLAGVPITGYHFFSDLVVAELARVWHLPVVHLFFHFMPVLISFSTAFLIYYLVKVWGGKQREQLFAWFFFYLGGDGAYIIYFYLHRSLSFHTAAIDNGMEQFFNPPHVYAKMVFLASLLVLFLWQKFGRKQLAQQQAKQQIRRRTTKQLEKAPTQQHAQLANKFWALTYLLLAVSLVGFKIYYGIFTAMAFSIYLLVRVLKSWREEKSVKEKSIWLVLKAQRLWIFTWLAMAVLMAALYFPQNHQSGRLYWSVLQWPKLLMAPHNLDFRDWLLRRQVYEQVGSQRGLAILNVLAFVLAMISIYGSRLLGFWPNRGLKKRLGSAYFLALFIPTITFIFLGLFTLQEPGSFNVFNFFIVSLVIFSLLAVFNLSALWRSRIFLGKIIAILLIIITVPKALSVVGFVFKIYRQDKVQILISQPEYQSLLEIKKILQARKYPRKANDREFVIQSHLANTLDMNTPYVSFFVDTQSYGSGFGLLSDHGRDISRQDDLSMIFSASDSAKMAHQMQTHGIDYLYLQKKPLQQLSFDLAAPLELVYDSEVVQLIGLQNAATE